MVKNLIAVRSQRAAMRFRSAMERNHNPASSLRLDPTTTLRPQPNECRFQQQRFRICRGKARVRSLIRLRSSSASTPIICHIARPVGVVVLIASVNDRNLMPRSRKPSSMAIRSRKLQPSLSSFQTMSVSPGCSCFRQRRRAGRFVVAPLIPSRRNIFAQPASFNAASCRAGD